MDSGQRFFSGFKNVVIVALIMLCVYQTVGLWLGGMSTLDFLRSFGFFAYGGAPGYDYDETLSTILKPKRVLVSVDDGARGEFSCRYTGIRESEQYAAAIRILNELVLTGSYAGETRTSDVDWSRYLEGDVLIFDYGFLMPATAFTAALLSKSTLISDHVKGFDMVFFMPLEGGGCEVVFADTQSDEHVFYRFDAVNAETPPPVSESDGLRYMASALCGLDFGRLIFMPTTLSGTMDYTRVETVNPLGNAVLNITSVQNMLGHFFDDSDGVNCVVDDDDLYTFSDGYTVVHYKDAYYLDYADWRTRPGRNIDSFEEAYAEAAAFLENDEHLINEYYLASYYMAGADYVFCFNYIINDLPVRLHGDLLKSLKMDGDIEVTVVKDGVSRYKRYSMSFRSDMSYVRSITVDYNAILQNLQKHGITPQLYGGVRGMDLVYGVDQYNKTVLQVIVDYDGVYITLEQGS